MSNNSATGGYLAPTTTNGNTEDVLFSQFLQPIIVGITGLPGAMVRPRWQPEPPNLPDYATDWCAIGTVKRTPDTHAFESHASGAGETPGSDNVFRVQELSLLASFYGPNSDANSDLLIQGFSLSQNREAMLLAGYAFIGCDSPIMTADLLNEKWTRRVDVSFQVRRGQTYTYPVLDLEGAQVTIVTDNGLPPIAVLAEEE
jgi:hypothetical protein